MRGGVLGGAVLQITYIELKTTSLSNRRVMYLNLSQIHGPLVTQPLISIYYCFYYGQTLHYACGHKNRLTRRAMCLDLDQVGTK